MADKNSDTAKPMSKTEVLKELAGKTGLEPKQVGSVFQALEELILEQLSNKGPGVFVLPNLVKLKVVVKPATKAGTKSVAGRMVEVKAKPSTVKVKPVLLKGLKDLSK